MQSEDVELRQLSIGYRGNKGVKTVATGISATIIACAKALTEASGVRVSAFALGFAKS